MSRSSYARERTDACIVSWCLMLTSPRFINGYLQNIYTGGMHAIEEEPFQGGIKIQCILSCHIRGSTSINWLFYLGFDEREKSVEYPEKT